MNSQISANHFASLSQHVQQLCRPLERIGIHLFSYRKTFLDGSRINISNNENWITDYYQYKLYQSSLFENSIENYHTGFSLWPHESALPVFTHGRNYYNSDNGITYIVKNKNDCEFFIFGADKNNKAIINFYLNHLDLIKKFSDYFRENSDMLIKKAMEKIIIIPPVQQKLQNELNSSLHFDKLFVDDLFLTKSINLTRQESHCLQGIMAGKTSKMIAKDLQISFRTVEYYIENIKKKSGCKNRFEILKKFC